ncbi:hypothetical protein TrVFT333_010979 [Trichoderma virens FT-333]|nr:hypothetical protein TrVFT333_010979 [Trichoderma virens FT-333]
MDGREIAPLNPDQIREAVKSVVAAGIGAIALVGVFSPLDHHGIHEEQCRRIILDAAPELRVVCSHDIGPTGLLERENATILNAAILRTGEKVKRGFKRAMDSLRLTCPLFLSQNDGTLIDVETASKYPIKTFASGPTNSMTGAAFLAGLDTKSASASNDNPNDAVEPQILVVDIGGTTTDVCALLPSGFPRQAPGFVEIGGVRTAFSMPEVVSIGLGGGSKVEVEEDGTVRVGPGSVGHFIKKQAKVFGGSTLTATDIVVALGKTDLGDASLIKDVPEETISLARMEIKRKLERVIDQMKVSSAPVHVLLVGGGALLVTEELAGVDKCIHPIHQGAANAVGAAIAKVSGEVDTVEILEGKTEKDVLDAACARAINMAIEKGASPDDVRIVEINKMPLQYMSQTTIRIQVRAVGKLAIPDEPTPPPTPPTGENPDYKEEEVEEEKVSVPNALEPTTKPSLYVDLETYRPDVRDGVWYVSEVDLELMSTGCGVLGTGGGGPTHYEFLKSLHALRTGGQGKMRIISPKALKDTDSVCFGSWYGSPSVINERLSGGNEIPSGIEAAARIVGKSIDALLPDEIGGGNGLSSFPTSAHFDVPIVDGDAMGRAYPTMYHVTFSVYGVSLVPCVLTDARNNVSVVMSTDTPERLETILRTTAIELGLSCAACSTPLSGSIVKQYGIPNTLSQTWYLGRAIHKARRSKTSYIDAIFAESAGKLLFSGKIVDVRRHLGGGYTMGAVIIAPLDEAERDATAVSKQQTASTSRHMTIPFQNEYLYAALTDSEGSEETQEVVCTVPDLISILGQDGEAIGSQDLRYGLHVNVIALPAHPLWKSERGIKVGGPEGFGFKMPVVEVDREFTQARSVIDEFST